MRGCGESGPCPRGGCRRAQRSPAPKGLCPTSSCRPQSRPGVITVSFSVDGGQKGQCQSDWPRLALTVGETRSRACGRPLDAGEGKARDGPVGPLGRNAAPRPLILAQRDPGQASDPQNQKTRTRCCSKPPEGATRAGGARKAICLPTPGARGGRGGRGGCEAPGQLPLTEHAPASRARPSVTDQGRGRSAEVGTPLSSARRSRGVCDVG